MENKQLAEELYKVEIENKKLEIRALELERDELASLLEKKSLKYFERDSYELQIKYIKEQIHENKEYLNKLENISPTEYAEQVLHEKREFIEKYILNKKEELSDIGEIERYVRYSVIDEIAQNETLLKKYKISNKFKKLSDEEKIRFISTIPELATEFEAKVSENTQLVIESDKKEIKRDEETLRMTDEELIQDRIERISMARVSNMSEIRRFGIANAMGMKTGRYEEKGLVLSSKLNVLGELTEETYQKEILEAVQGAAKDIRKKYRKEMVLPNIKAGIATPGLLLSGGIAGGSALWALTNSSLLTNGELLEGSLLFLLGSAGIAGCATILKNHKDNNSTLSDYVEEYIIKKLQGLGYLEQRKEQNENNLGEQPQNA